MDQVLRKNDLKAWLNSFMTITDFLAIPGDASARHYFRVATTSGSFIAVDAPPQTENSVAFVSIAKGLEKKGLNVPQIHQVDYERGFLLLSDLGNTQLLTVLHSQNVQQYYGNAIEALIKLQGCNEFIGYQPPDFNDRLLSEELSRFHDWYLNRHLGIELTSSEMKLLHETYKILIEQALAQPQVFVHRDYHSRNIMLLENNDLGILDFQDGVVGPLSYDLVSLLRDCYIEWPIDKIYQWVTCFWELLPNQHRARSCQEQFIQCFDWMGLQRHLKVLGIFARLYRRDNKHIYLADIPRILCYVMTICDKYPKLHAFKSFLITRVLPHESNDISSRQRKSTASLDG